MMQCKRCGEETDELIPVRVGARTRKVCEDCVEVLQEEAAIAEAAEASVRSMMEYKG